MDCVRFPFPYTTASIVATFGDKYLVVHDQYASCRTLGYCVLRKDIHSWYQLPELAEFAEFAEWIEYHNNLDYMAAITMAATLAATEGK